MSQLNPTIQEQMQVILNSERYRHASWGIGVADTTTGETLFEINGDQLFIPASTTKLWSCAAALNSLGSDHRFVTPVYQRGEIGPDGTLAGELILRGMGDPNLSGRTDPDGRLLFTNHDHTYADYFEPELTGGADPFAGLDNLAGQIAGCGIRRVKDVLVDDRIFDREAGEFGGPLRSSPVMVNDNVIDIILTPGSAPGELASIHTNPPSAYAQFDCSVETGKAGTGSEVKVERLSPRSFTVKGRIEAGRKPLVKVAWIEEPQDFARTLLIERLEARGVRVERSRLLPSNRESLPRVDDYEVLPVVARHTSPPFSETIQVVLKVSHNPMANVLPQLVASHFGERTAQMGLRRQGEFLKHIGVEAGSVSFGSGAGGSMSDHTSPKAALRLLQAMASRPDAKVYREALPILGVDGTLADAVGQDSPVRGKVYAKTGTAMMENSLDGSYLLLSKALAGYMTAASGRELTIALFVNRVPLDSVQAIMEQGQVLGKVCEILYQAW